MLVSAPPHCQTHITDAPVPPVSLLDDAVTGVVTLVVQRAALHADPEDIIRRIGEHWDVGAQKYRAVQEVRSAS